MTSEPTTKPQVQVRLRALPLGDSFDLVRCSDGLNEAQSFVSRAAAELWAMENGHPLCYHRWTHPPKGEHECFTGVDTPEPGFPLGSRDA